MNSKEALEDIRDYHNETVIDNYCTYTENMFEKELDIIDKDLELLDIIKFLIKKGDIVVNPDLFVDYPELYEWLEQNEWNINKSNKFNQCYKNID